MSNDDNLIDSAKSISQGQASHFARNKHWTALGHNILWRPDGAVVNPIDLGSGRTWVARHPAAHGGLVGKFSTQGKACDAVGEEHPWPPEEKDAPIGDLPDETFLYLLNQEGWRVCTPWEKDGEQTLTAFPGMPGTDGPYWPLFHRKTLVGLTVATIFKDGRFRLLDETGETTEERITGTTEIAKSVVDSILKSRGFIVLDIPED